MVCRKADIDIHKRAGELSEEDLEKLTTVMLNPTQYKIPTWFLNRQKDIRDGKNTQVLSTSLETKYRDDFERMKKIRLHRGLRHYWGLRVCLQIIDKYLFIFPLLGSWTAYQDHWAKRTYRWCVEEEGRLKNLKHGKERFIIHASLFVACSCCFE